YHFVGPLALFKEGYIKITLPENRSLQSLLYIMLQVGNIMKLNHELQRTYKFPLIY
ncbi:hypothetical protein L9F63_020102, partial [Diploptera punctata]